MATGKYCIITEDVILGKDVVIRAFVNLYGCKIGRDSRIGTFVEVQENTTVGNRVRIQSHSFICSNVIIEDDVFIGHNVSFINDRYPTSKKAEDKTWKVENTVVRRGASIGTGAVIMCGVEIGEGAIVGAGSVVIHNVASHSVVAGVPAKILRTLPQDDLGLGEGTDVNS